MANYIATFGMDNIGSASTFVEAFNILAKAIRKQMEIGMTVQMLETTCWIKTPHNTVHMFYDARDLAIREGWTPEMMEN